ncbi:MAG: FtsW/RodA/SpoVE family cell cycle protein, partial [Candidatus Poribacteria bacterium]
ILWEICFGYKDFMKNSRAPIVKAAKKNWFIKRYTFFIVVLALSVILYGMFQVYQSGAPRIHINEPSLKRVICLSKTSPILIGNSSEINSYDTIAVVLKQQGIARRHARIRYDEDRSAWEIEKLDGNPIIIKRTNEEIRLDKAATKALRKIRKSSSSSLILMNNDKIQLGGAFLEIEIPSPFAFSSRNGFLIGIIFAVACLVTLGSIIDRIHTQNYFLFPVGILLSGLGLIMMYKLTLISTKPFLFFHFIKLLSALLGFIIIIKIPNSVWSFLGRSLLSAVKFPFRLLISIRDILRRNRDKGNFLSVKYSRPANYLFSDDSSSGNPYSMAHFLLAASMILLLLPIAFGGRLGINLSFVRIQPTEFAKIILIYYFTILICLYLTKADNLSPIFKRFRLVSPILIMMIIPAVTLAALHDFGPILLLYAIILVLFYIGSSRLLEPVITTIFLLCTCVLFILFKPNSIVFIAYFSLLMLFLLINPHLRILGLISFFGFILLESGIYFKLIRPEHFRVIAERLQIWENPWGAYKGLQLAKSLWLIRDSGWLGGGFSWNDLSILPPAFHTDFIFTVIVATFGFAGAVLIFVCYLLIAYAGLKIVASSFDNSISTGIKRSMLIGGIVFAISFQAFVIIAGNIGVLPLTGITLPLLSYGGSSLLATFILIGLMYK